MTKPDLEQQVVLHIPTPSDADVGCKSDLKDVPLHAFLSNENGRWVILGVCLDGVNHLPMCSTDERVISKMRPFAQNRAAQQHRRVVLVKFTGLEVVEVHDARN